MPVYVCREHRRYLSSLSVLARHAGHLKKDVEQHAHQHDAQKEQLSQLGLDLGGMGFEAPSPINRSVWTVPDTWLTPDALHIHLVI